MRRRLIRLPVFGDMIMDGKINATIVSIFLALLLAPLALGFTVTQVTVTGPTTQVTTGTSVTVSAVVTSDESGNANQISLVGTGQGTGASLSVTDPSSGSFSTTSITTSGTTLNFVVAPAVADTYDYTVNAQYSTGSTSSTSSVLQVVSPSSLSVSGSANSTSHAVGTVFQVSVTVSNPSPTANVTSSYALTFASPSAFTLVSGDSSSGTLTLEPSGAVTFTYNIQAASAATSSNILFGLGSTTDSFSQAVTNTAGPTPVPSNGGSTSTATPTPAATAAATATSQPGFIPTAKTTTGEGESVVASESKQIGMSSAVTGSFAENSASFEIAYTAPAGGFIGKYTNELPFECADYESGLISITPSPSDVQCGSIIATWDIALAAYETFVATIEVAKNVDRSVINEFKAPKLAPRASAATPVPQTSAPAASEEPVSAPTPAGGTDNTMLYILGALVVLGLLYYFVAMRGK